MTAELQDTAKTEIPEAPVPDLELILPDPGEMKVSGIDVLIRRLRTREFLALIKILTHGLAGGLADIKIDTKDPEQMQANLVGMFAMALPEAVDEFVQFVFTITDPKVETDRARLAIELQNPDPGEVLDLLGIVAIQEKDDLAALAGKVQAWIAKIQKAYRPTPTTAG